MQKQVKTRLIRCALAVVLALVLLLSSVAPLFAEDLDTLKGEKEQLEQDAADNLASQNDIQARIEGVSQEILTVTNEIAQLDTKINTCLKNIADLEVKIEENETLLKETQTQLDEAKEDEAQHYEELILLGSKDISEFFSRIEYVGQMAEHDKKIQDNLEKDRQKIQEIEGSIQKTQLELDIDKKKLEDEKQSLEDNKAEKQSLYDSLQSTKQDYEEYQAYLAQIESEIQNMITDKINQINDEEARLAQLEAERQQQNNNTAGGGTDAGGSGSSSGSGSGVSNGYFTWPVPSSSYISSPYGWRVHPIWGSSLFHAGTDIGADYGDSILAADGGTVIYAGYNDSYGNFVMISHSSGYVTLYAHCNQLLVYSGQSVSQGETIALVGSTGDSTGPHCHFEVRYNGSTVDGMSFF